MRDLVTPSTQTHTHTHMSVTLTHTRKRLGRCGGRAGYRARAPRRIRKGNRDEKKRSKNESRRPSFRVPTRDAFDGSPQHDNYYFTPEGADLYPADLSTRPRDHTRGCKSTGDPGRVARHCFFHRARRRFRLSRYFQGCRRPVKRLRRRHAHTHTHARDVAIELHRPPAPSTFDERRRRACSGAHRHRAIDGYR